LANTYCRLDKLSRYPVLENWMSVALFKLGLLCECLECTVHHDVVSSSSGCLGSGCRWWG